MNVLYQHKAEALIRFVNTNAVAEKFDKDVSWEMPGIPEITPPLIRSFAMCCRELYATFSKSEEYEQYILNYAISIVAMCDAENHRKGRCNRIYLSETDDISLTPSKIAKIAKCNTTAQNYKGPNNRLDGILCACNGNGEFVIDNPNVDTTKEKVYCQCRKCGQWTHL